MAFWTRPSPEMAALLEYRELARAEDAAILICLLAAILQVVATSVGLAPMLVLAAVLARQIQTHRARAQTPRFALTGRRRLRRDVAPHAWMLMPLAPLPLQLMRWPKLICWLDMQQPPAILALQLASQAAWLLTKAGHAMILQVQKLLQLALAVMACSLHRHSSQRRALRLVANRDSDRARPPIIPMQRLPYLREQLPLLQSLQQLVASRSQSS